MIMRSLMDILYLTDSCKRERNLSLQLIKIYKEASYEKNFNDSVYVMLCLWSICSERYNLLE